MNLENILSALPKVFIRQQKELAEIFGFETRNKYSIESEDGKQIGFAAEQQKGMFGFLFRQMLGHWRKYDIHIFGPDRELEIIAHHPFRFYYQKLEVKNSKGELLGVLERKFEIFGKKFDLFDKKGKLLYSVRSPIWRIWTFPFKRDGEEFASVSKKWGGVLKEVFLDADNFILEFTKPNLPPDQKALLLVAAIFIDLRYFEKKGSSAGAPFSFVPG